jgi:hypothetical protein
MQYKKIILLPALFILSNVLYISCCKCPEVTQKFYAIINGSVTAKGSRNAIIDTGAITNVDSVFLNYKFASNCVAKAENPFAFLVNTSYAFKCDCGLCGEMGLKNKILSIDITSDSVYNNIVANGSLKQFFKARQYDYTTASYASFSLDSLKTKVNNNKDGLIYNEELFTTTKPGNTRGHSLKLTLIFADSSKVSILSRRIRWN